MTSPLRSMKRIVHAPRVRGDVPVSHVDRVDQEPFNTPTALAGEGLTSVHDVDVELGPTWTDVDRVMDRSRSTWEIPSPARRGPGLEDGSLDPLDALVG